MASVSTSAPSAPLTLTQQQHTGRATSGICASSMSPQCDRFACVDRSGQLMVVDMQQPTYPVVLNVPNVLAQGACYGLAWASDNNILVIGGGAGAVGFYDFSAAKCNTANNAHSSYIWGVAASPVSQFAVSAGSDGNVIVWDVDQAQKVRSVGSCAAYETRPAFSHSGESIAYATNSGIALEDIQGTSRATMALSGNIRTIVFTSDDQYLYVLANDVVTVVEASTMSTVLSITVCGSNSWAAMLSPRDDFLFMSTQTSTPSWNSGAVSIVDLQLILSQHPYNSSKPPQVQASNFNPATLALFTSYVYSGAFNETGDVLALASDDGTYAFFSVSPPLPRLSMLKSKTPAELQALAAGLETLATSGAFADVTLVVPASDGVHVDTNVAPERKRVHSFVLRQSPVFAAALDNGTSVPDVVDAISKNELAVSAAVAPGINHILGALYKGELAAPQRASELVVAVQSAALLGLETLALMLTSKLARRLAPGATDAPVEGRESSIDPLAALLLVPQCTFKPLVDVCMGRVSTSTGVDEATFVKLSPAMLVRVMQILSGQKARGDLLRTLSVALLNVDEATMPAARVLAALDEQWQAARAGRGDATLCAHGASVSVHAAIAGAQSGLLRRAFAEGPTFNDTFSKSAASLAAIAQFLYTGTLPSDLTGEAALELIGAGAHYEMSTALAAELDRVIFKSCEDHMHPSNALALAARADKADAVELLDLLMKAIANRLTAILAFQLHAEGTDEVQVRFQDLSERALLALLKHSSDIGMRLLLLLQAKLLTDADLSAAEEEMVQARKRAERQAAAAAAAAASTATGEAMDDEADEADEANDDGNNNDDDDDDAGDAGDGNDDDDDDEGAGNNDDLFA